LYEIVQITFNACARARVQFEPAGRNIPDDGVRTDCLRDCVCVCVRPRTTRRARSSLVVGRSTRAASNSSNSKRTFWSEGQLIRKKVPAADNNHGDRLVMVGDTWVLSPGGVVNYFYYRFQKNRFSICRCHCCCIISSSNIFYDWNE